MAVPQNRKTSSKRGMHRSHKALSGPALSEDKTTGELHRRHHIELKHGHYRGRQVITPKIPKPEKE